jgi:hypothetical protein
MKYSIKDLTQFSQIMRHKAAISLVDDKKYEQDLDEFITIEQVKNIVSSFSVGKDEADCLLIENGSLNDIFNEIKKIIYQSSLSRLASAGYIECAWDDENNRMTFWMNSKNGQLDILPLPD